MASVVSIYGIFALQRGGRVFENENGVCRQQSQQDMTIIFLSRMSVLHCYICKYFISIQIQLIIINFIDFLHKYTTLHYKQYKYTFGNNP